MENIEMNKPNGIIVFGSNGSGKITLGCYESRMKFRDFIASRSLSKIEQWAETLVCPVICIDGTLDWQTNAKNIIEFLYA